MPQQMKNTGHFGWHFWRGLDSTAGGNFALICATECGMHSFYALLAHRKIDKSLIPKIFNEYS